MISLRERYMSPYYIINPNMDKLSELFNNKGRKLFNLAKYVQEGLKLFLMRPSLYNHKPKYVHMLYIVYKV